MPAPQHIAPPLVSVIIPCYNHGTYLPEALESIQQQQYAALEVIVVDDGSTDTTKAVAAQYPEVKYVHQENQGLSAARNKGIQYSSGEYLVFLDADDWLLPKAISTNLRYLQQYPEAAFVSGAHDKVFVDTNTRKEESCEIKQHHYLHLLQGNYIGMHATVMYRRWVFKEFQYDTSLRACEDYDLYLKVARKYPVVHHPEKIAAYRLHAANMSGNIPLMLGTVLQVLERQEEELQNEAERQAYQRGQQVWKDYYGKELYLKLRQHTAPASPQAQKTLRKYKPGLYVKYFLNKLLP